MDRAWLYGFLLLAVAGCVAPVDRVPLRPLAEDAPAQPYAELLTRARAQASAANETFYLDAWADLEEYARGLEQTARFLGRAIDVPASHKEKLVAEAADLEKEARQLREAAKAHEPKQANEVMRRINLKVRELRIEK